MPPKIRMNGTVFPDHKNQTGMSVSNKESVYFIASRDRNSNPNGPNGIEPTLNATSISFATKIKNPTFSVTTFVVGFVSTIELALSKSEFLSDNQTHRRVVTSRKFQIGQTREAHRFQSSRCIKNQTSTDEQKRVRAKAASVDYAARRTSPGV